MLVISKRSGGRPFIAKARQDRCFSSMQRQDMKKRKRLLEDCTAIESKAECTGSDKGNKNKKFEKKLLPKGKLLF